MSGPEPEAASYSPKAIRPDNTIITSELANGSSYSPKAIKPEDAKPKRLRRAKATVNGIRDAIVELLEESHPQTVRQVYYALTVKGLIGKTQKEYKQTVMRLLVEMRENGAVSFDWIADSTRLMRKPDTYTGVDRALAIFAKAYRRDLWAAAPVYVEIWCEKDALTGVLLEETDVYDVPLMSARGYSSLTFLHSAAKTIEAFDRPTYIYHFGDLDPSGQDAASMVRSL